MLDLDQTIEIELAFCIGHLDAVPGAQVVDMHPGWPGGGVGAGAAGVEQFVGRLLRFSPGLWRLVRVEAGLAEGGLVDEQHRGGQRDRQRKEVSLGVAEADAQFGRQFSAVEGQIGFLHHLMQRFEIRFCGDETRLFLTRHQIQVLGSIALHAAHESDLVFLLLRIEPFNQLLETLGALFVKLMRKIDLCRCATASEENGAARASASAAGRILSKRMRKILEVRGKPAIIIAAVARPYKVPPASRGVRRCCPCRQITPGTTGKDPHPVCG
jgi:hypothetical protein